MEAAQGSTLATLLVSCPDRRGIVAALAQVLYGHGANILDSDQHTDSVAGLFFQRLRFDLAELMTDRVALERSLLELAERFQMQYRLLYQARRKRIAIFVSKYDHCLYDLLLRQRAGELNGEIAAVLSNHADLRPVAAQFGVPFHVFEKTAQTKLAQEQQERALLEELETDLVVLARYMQVMSESFCAAFSQRVINIHHSFLPAFVGGKPYHQAYERGVKLIGATAHYATAVLDQGPIIEQDVVRASHRDAVEDLVRKGRDIERRVLARAVGLHLDGRVIPNGSKTIVFRD
jgi:formyltetrahydrofolate deformylase